MSLLTSSLLERVPKYKIWIKNNSAYPSNDKDVFKRNRVINDFIDSISDEDDVYINCFKILVIKEICFHHVAYAKLSVDENYICNLKETIMVMYGMPNMKSKIDNYINYIAMKVLTKQKVILDSKHISNFLNKY